MLIKKLAQYLQSIVGWRLQVEWEDKQYIHYAWTRREINQWAECYPQGKCWLMID